MQSDTIVINDSPFETGDPVINHNNRTFVPISRLVNILGGTVTWNQENRKALISTAHGDQIHFMIDHPEMKLNKQPYFMDVAPFIYEGRTYVPLRHAAEFLHAKVGWDQASKTAAMHEVPVYLSAEGDTWSGVSVKFGIKPELLMERNQAAASTRLEAGTPIRIVIPDIMANKIPAPSGDLMLLARIIQVEAGYESYQGQIAVGNVVLNRVDDRRFPDSIRDVIYQPGQFPPAHNGLLDKIEPNESVLKAANAVLNGQNNVEDAIYFYNPKVTGGKYWDSLTLVKEIGNHRFVK